MEAGVLSQAVYMWLTEHPNVVGYLEIGAIVRESDVPAEMERRLQQLGKVTNFLNLTLLAHPPKIDPLLPMPEIGDPPAAFSAARKTRFLQTEIARTRREKFDDHVKTCNDIIDLLSHEGNQCIVLDVQEESLFADMLALDPDRITALESATEQFHTEYEKALVRPGQSHKSRLKRMIKECKESYDSSINFFPRIPAQDSFDSWLMEKDMPLREEIDTFLKDFEQIQRQHFTAKLIGVFRQLRKAMDIRVAVDVSILVLLFFRTMFEEAYARAPGYFFPVNTKGILTEASHLTCADLSPPEEFIEPFKPDDLVSVAFNRDPCYRDAGRAITAAMFETNPIDVLYNIHQALVNVQNGVSKNMDNTGQKELLPFETVFALFFGSVMASDAVNFEALVAFVVDFAPSGRLCPAFQYSQVTLTATLSQLETFVASKK